MKLGEYEVLSTIGQGGMGTVVRVLAPDGQERALKLLLSPRPDRVKRFERERRLLDSLGRTKGFVSVLDWGDSQLGPFFIMPLLEGGSLGDQLKKGPLSLERTLEVGIAVARAMGQAHKKKIIHRDLKPDNILFDADGTPLVADLGLAKYFSKGEGDDQVSASHAGWRLSSTGEVRGTFGYMAPEQIRDSKSVGPRADVFALGAILYECLTGGPAFPGSTPIEVLGRITAGEYDDLEKTGAPAWLQDVIRGALSFDPKERPADAGALAKALSRGFTPTGLRWARRRIAVYTGAVLGLVLLMSFGDELRSIMAWRPGKAESPEVAPLTSLGHPETPRAE